MVEIAATERPAAVTGVARAEDASGLDSMWLSLDGGMPVGQNGRFETAVQSNFRLVIPATHHAGDRIPIELRARDLDGFASQRDTTVRVVP